MTEYAKRLPFNIKQDMTDEEIIKELRGKTSGETKQELEQFFIPNKEVAFKLPSHNVVVEDGEYAVIAKSIQNKTPFGHFTLSFEYWIAGINDEGKYFCHPLTGYQGKASIESILEWTNRTDEGFTKRLQGDVLLQFVKLQYPLSHNAERKEYNIRIGNQSFYVYYDNHLTKEISLNNHKISTDGGITTIPNYTVVFGTHVILQHPQHGMIEEKIPLEHAAVLTNQRGRFRNGGFD